MNNVKKPHIGMVASPKRERNPDESDTQEEHANP
jgi:hypothetical protein